MRLLVLLSFYVLISACHHSALHNKLSGCDSLVINFNAAGTDSVIKTVATTESNAIKKLIDFVDGNEAKDVKCGFDGNLIFFKSNRAILPVVFEYSNSDCRQFLFQLDAVDKRTRMSQEAADFLESLQEGKLFY